MFGAEVLNTFFYTLEKMILEPITGEQQRGVYARPEDATDYIAMMYSSNKEVSLVPWTSNPSTNEDQINVNARLIDEFQDGSQLILRLFSIVRGEESDAIAYYTNLPAKMIMADAINAIKEGYLRDFFQKECYRGVIFVRTRTEQPFNLTN